MTGTQRVRRRDLRLALPALAAWGTAFAVAFAPGVAAGVAAAGWALTCAAVVVAVRGPQSARRAIALAAVTLAVAAAVASHVALQHPVRDPARELALDGGRAVEVSATVTSKVERSGDRLWFDADASQLAIGSSQHRVAVPVTVAVPVDEVSGGRLDLGSSVTVRGTGMRADPGERAVLVLFARRGLTVTESPPGVLAATSWLRERFVAAASGLPEPGAGLLPGLAVGDTRAVSDELDAAMKTGSLSHLTAVSGANCALVVGIAFGLAAACRARRIVRVIAALVALGGFVLLVTPEPSVLRAAAMASISMLAVLLGRAGAGFAVLAAAVIVLLVADPWLATSYGFVLSAVATGALVLLVPPLARGLSRWIPGPLALAVVVPLSAQLACGPILVLLTPTVSLYGVLANLLAAPAAPAATIIGLLACLSAPIPPLAAGLAAIAWLPSAWIAATATTLADWPDARLPWLPGGGGMLLLALVGVAVVVLLIRPSAGAGRRATVARRTAAAVLTVVVGVTAGQAALRGIAGPLTAPRDWSVAACDVGQGDAVLVRSGGAIALIDTGPEPDALGACLSRLGISRIDLLILTHFDVDHVGGVDAVLGRVGTVLHGPRPDDGRRFVLDGLADAGARIEKASEGLTGMLGEARWRVLWPAGAATPGNDASVVVEISGGGVPRSLFLGDLSASAQAAMLAHGAVSGPYDIVKVAHHGSADQDPALYRIARPRLALVSAGADNDYGHPRSETLDMLAALGATVGRTDTDGLLLVTATAGELGLWRGHPVGAGQRSRRSRGVTAGNPVRRRR